METLKLNPTPNEQYMLELVNQARANPGEAAAKYNFSLGNNSNKPLEPLAMNEDLLEGARAHSSWMEKTDTFSHTGQGGSDPSQRAKEAGWDGGGVGENISSWYTFGRSNDDVSEIVEERHAGLLRSPGHLANIMNPNWSEAGVGMATGDWKNGGQYYDKAYVFTQNFSDDGKSYLTGVAFNDADGDNFYDPGEGLGGLKVDVTDSNGKKVETSTWDAGGYKIALADGNYKVSYSGGELDGVVEKKVSIDGGNVKVDLNSDNESQVIAKVPPAVTTDPDNEKPEDKVVETKDTKTTAPEVKTPEATKKDGEAPDNKMVETKDPGTAAPDIEIPIPVKSTAEPILTNGTPEDDVFMDKPSDQIILGGSGMDKFQSDNSFGDFQFQILPNDGVLLLGKDVAKILYGVEALEFSDLSIQFKPDTAEATTASVVAPQNGESDTQTGFADDTHLDFGNLRTSCPYQDDMAVA